jgi:hypothetical protein
MNRFLRDTRQPCAEALTLETRILELQKQLAAALHDKEMLLAKHALVSRLPPEILSRIFELGVHQDLHLLPRISLVSRLWRHVAVKTPTLSSYLRLDGSWGYGASRAFLEHANVLLDRAGDSKLCVELDCRYVDDTAALEALASGIAPHLQRAYSFNLSVPDWDWFVLVQKHVQPHLGGDLEELTLRIDPAGDEVVAAQFLAPEKTYPRLHKLVLEQCPLAAVRGAHLPALRSLRLSRDTRFHSLNRMAVDLGELLAFLGAHPQLEELAVHGVRFALAVDAEALCDAPTRIAAPALRTASFTHVDGPGVGACLASLALPALATLVLSMETCDSGDLGFLAGALADGAALPALRALDLRNINTDGPALFPLVRTLRRLPRLAALGLCTPPSGALGAKLFDLLTSGGPSERWLLPHLEALSLINARDVTGYEVLAAVNARKAAGRDAGGHVDKLRFVRIAHCCVEDDALDALEDAVEVFRHEM